MMASGARIDMTVSAPQLGKSFALGAWLLALAWVDGGKVRWPSWWVAPTFAQAQQGFMRYVVGPAREAGILRSHTESTPVRAVLTCGSWIEARSWERADGLYGPTVSRIAVDEFGLLDEAAWAALSSRTTETSLHGFGQIRMAGNVSDIGGIAEKLYRTAMDGRNGWAARTWTWRHRAQAAVCECGLNGEGMDLDLADLHGDACERGIYLRDLANRRAVMSEAHFRQLYGAEWVDWSALPAYQFDRAVHVTDEVHDDPSLPLDLACDFNVDPMAWVVGQHRRDEAWALDEIAIPGGATTQLACAEFLRRYPGHKTRELLVYGDPSGNSRSTKSKETDYQIIRTMLSPHWRLRMMVKSAHPPVTERLNAFNAMLAPATGAPRYYLHPRCTQLANDLARVSLKPGTRELDKSNRHLTHFSDADGYRVETEFPVITVGPIKTSGHVASLDSYQPDLMSTRW